MTSLPQLFTAGAATSGAAATAKSTSQASVAGVSAEHAGSESANSGEERIDFSALLKGLLLESMIPEEFLHPFTDQKAASDGEIATASKGVEQHSAANANASTDQISSGVATTEQTVGATLQSGDTNPTTSITLARLLQGALHHLSQDSHSDIDQVSVATAGELAGAVDALAGWRALESQSGPVVLGDGTSGQTALPQALVAMIRGVRDVSVTQTHSVSVSSSGSTAAQGSTVAVAQGVSRETRTARTNPVLWQEKTVAVDSSTVVNKPMVVDAAPLATPQSAGPTSTGVELPLAVRRALQPTMPHVSSQPPMVEQVADSGVGSSGSAPSPNRSSQNASGGNVVLPDGTGGRPTTPLQPPLGDSVARSTPQASGPSPQPMATPVQQPASAVPNPELVASPPRVAGRMPEPGQFPVVDAAVRAMPQGAGLSSSGATQPVVSTQQVSSRPSSRGEVPQPAMGDGRGFSSGQSSVGDAAVRSVSQGAGLSSSGVTHQVVAAPVPQVPSQSSAGGETRQPVVTGARGVSSGPAQLAEGASRVPQQPVVAPVQQPVVAPVQQPVVAPVQQPVVAPVQQSVVAPVSQPSPQTVAGQVNAPTSSSVSTVPNDEGARIMAHGREQGASAGQHNPTATHQQTTSATQSATATPPTASPTAAAAAASATSSTTQPTAHVAPASTTSPAVPTAPPAAVELARQVSAAFGALRELKSGTHQLSIKVTPEEFGPVKVVARIEAGAVGIDLHTASATGRELLKAAMADIRRDLPPNIAGATVTVADGNSGQASGGFTNQQGAGQGSAAYDGRGGQRHEGNSSSTSRQDADVNQASQNISHSPTTSYEGGLDVLT